MFNRLNTSLLCLIDYFFVITILLENILKKKKKERCCHCKEQVFVQRPAELSISVVNMKYVTNLCQVKNVILLLLLALYELLVPQDATSKVPEECFILPMAIN